MAWRFRLAEQVGPWRETAIEAREDALAAGYARRERGIIFVDELVQIEAGTEEPSPPRP